jgi:hypothetical protein
MSFENEILVSYAPSAGSENQTTSAWTLKFCEYLAILMNRLYDKKTAILLHDDLRAKQAVLGENMHDVLAKTAVFVTILSPEYAKSPAYIRDLEEIHQAASQENRAGKKHRIFKVHTLPLQNNEQLDCLREELSYEFYEINRYNKKPVTFDLNGKNGPHEKFWSKLVDLAYDIAEILNDLSGTDKASFTREIPAVFLAETSFDQTENRDMLKRELQHLGFRVLPLTPVPEEADKAKPAIEQNLRQSVMSIHLLGAWYGDFIKNSKYSFIDFQIKTAKDFIDSKDNPNKPTQVIWIPNDVKPTDQRQALYLKRLKRDEAQHMTEIVETPFEVFKTFLNTRLNDLIHPKVRSIAEKNKLYAIYEKPSAIKIGEYTNVLRSKGFEVLEPDHHDGEFRPISKHIQNLLIADAVLIYKGTSTMEWLNSKIRDLVKAPGYGKSKPFRVIEIISDKKTADKSLLFLKNVPVNWDEELNHEVIKHFIDHLAKK